MPFQKFDNCNSLAINRRWRAIKILGVLETSVTYFLSDFMFILSYSVFLFSNFSVFLVS